MPFEQTCPGCGATFELADKMTGKSLRCQECNQVFVGTPTQRKRAAAPAKSSSGFSLVAAVFGLVIVLFGLTCGLSVVLVAANFITPAPKPLANQDRKDDAITKEFDKGVPKRDDAPPKKDKPENPPAIVAPALPLDAYGRATINAAIKEGPVSYHVFLQKGKTYNFFAQSAEFEPKVKVTLEDRVLEAKQGTKSCFVSVTPEQSAEHTVTISARPKQTGAFSLQFAPAESRPVVKIDPSKRSDGYFAKDDLKIQNEFSPRWPNGPYRLFRMDVVAGNEYTFKVTSTQFKPVLRLLKDEGILGDWVADEKTDTLDASFKADFTGEVIVFVGTSTGLGAYTVNIKVAPDRPPVQAAGRRIEFKGDVFKQIAVMEKDAPRNEKGVPQVVYDFPMEAGWAYSIQHKHAIGDCGLILFGPDGRQIAATNRFANTQSVRILHDATITGNHRLHASVDGAGAQSYTLEVIRFKLPAPEAVNVKTVSRSKQAPGLAIKEAEVSKGFLRSQACAWSRDGSKLFVFDEAGWLHRYRMPDFFEEQKLFLDKDGVHEIQMSSEGIVIARTKLREFWVIDPDRLRIVRRVPTIYGAMIDKGAVLTGHNSSMAYTQTTGSVWDGPLMKGVAMYDLTGRTAMVGVSPNRLTHLLALSADGNTVFGKTEDGRLGRWRVVGKTMVLEDTGDWYGPTPSINPLNLSADGKFLFRTIMPVKAARQETNSVPPSGYGVLAYAVNDLSKPAFLIDTGSTAYTVASDPKTGKIYTYSDARGLLIADATGKVESVLGPIGNLINDRIRSIVFHPDGGKFVALVGNINCRVAYMELTNTAVPNVKEVPAPKLPPKAFLSKFEPDTIRVGDMTVQKIAWYIYWNTPTWSPDGKSFYIAQSQNILYEVDAKDFTIRNKNFFKPFTWIRGGASLSSEGVLSLGCGEKTQGADMDLIQMDPVTLKVINRIRCPHSSHVASARNLSVAFVGGKNIYQTPNQAELLAVNLKTAMVEKPDLTVPISPQTFQVSPDGKYFYGTDGRSIMRFRISGTKLIHEDTSKPIANEEKVMPRLELSTDGAKVWLVGQAPVGQKNALGIHMLDALDFTKPPRVIKERAYSAAIDPLTKALVLARHESVVDFLAAGGDAVPAGGDWKCDGPRQIIMHPQGGEMFMICNYVLYHVRWKK